MSFFDPQNPGLGGLDELTPAEELFVASLAGLPYAQGDILYHNGVSLTRLPAGTSGYFLKTQGAGANPLWAASAATLANVSANSLTAPDSLYTMTSGVPVVFDGTGGDVTIRGDITGASTTSNFFNVTGTLTTTPSVNPIGVLFAMTGAGTASVAQTAARVNLLAGYTGSSLATALTVVNSSASTGTSGWTGSLSNIGANLVTNGTTAGHNLGFVGAPSGSSSLNLGLFGRATSASNSASMNVGVAGFGLNAAAGSAVNVGGIFALMNGAPTISTSSALIADNGATTNAIFVAQDNGTAVVSIIDGGNVGIATTTPTFNLGFGGTTNRTIGVERNTISNTNGATLTISSGAATLGATDKASAFVLQPGLSTGGGVSNMSFQAPGVFAGPGPLLTVNLQDPYMSGTSGYTAGNVLTMAGTGSATAQVTIDTVDGSGIPVTWHVTTAGTAYSVGNVDFPTGGSGVNALFTVATVSGTADNTLGSIGSWNYDSFNITGTGSGRGNLNVTGDVQGKNLRTTTGYIIQRDNTALGEHNVLMNATTIGIQADPYADLGGKVIIYDSGTTALRLLSTNTTYPTQSIMDSVGGETTKMYGNGDIDFGGNINSAFGGFGLVQNYLLQSENPANASWTKTRVTATDNNVTSPDGTLTGGRVVANVTVLSKSIAQSTVSLPAGTYTASVYLRSDTPGDTVNFSIGGTVGTFLNLTTTWQRYRFSFTKGGAGTISFSITPGSGQTFYMWGTQVVDGGSADVYAHTTTATMPTALSALFSNKNIITLGNVGIGVTAPTARVHISAGTATASTAPLKFTSGTNLTVIENGAEEFDGTEFYLSAGGTRQTVAKGKSGSFSQVGAATTTFTVTFGGTQPNTTYRVFVTPTAVLSAALFYVTNKTTTTFDVVYLAGLTGTVTFDYQIIN